MNICANKISEFSSLYKSQSPYNRQILLSDLMMFPNLKLDSVLFDILKMEDMNVEFKVKCLIYSWKLNKDHEDRLLWELQRGELAHYAAVALALGGYRDIFGYLRKNMYENIWPYGDMIRYALCYLHDNESIRILKADMCEMEDSSQNASALILSRDADVSDILIKAMMSDDTSDQYYGVINSWCIRERPIRDLIKYLQNSSNAQVKAKAYQAEAHLDDGEKTYDLLYSSWADDGYFHSFPR